MTRIKVLKETNSIFNLQKLHINDKLLPPYTHGKFAIVRVPNKSLTTGSGLISLDWFCLCQIFFNKTLHPSFCYIDIRVCGLMNPNGKTSCFPIKKKIDCLSTDNISVLPSLKNIKKLSVTVVFDSSEKVLRWKGKTSRLIEIVKNILKVFAIKNNSVVYLEDVNIFLENKLLCLLIGSLGSLDFGRVVSTTKVKINNIVSQTLFEQIYTPIGKLPVLGGLEEPTKMLTEIVLAAEKERNNPCLLPVYKQVLILGPSGCGKTALVLRVASDCRVVVKVVSGPELTSPLPGEAEQALISQFNECQILAKECSGGCILLLDQVDSLCGPRERSSEGHLMRLRSQLFLLLEAARDTVGLVVVGTSSRPQSLDPALRRPGRFDFEIHINVSSESERVSILQAVTCKSGLDNSVCPDVARWTPGFVGADLALLANSVARHVEKLGLPVSHANKEEMLLYWRTCVGQLQPSALRGQLGVITGKKVTFSSLGGVQQVTQSLLQAIEWPLTMPQTFRRMGLPPHKGVLLYGPPGCAKTSLVQAIANATNTTFLAVSAANVYSPYVGDAERTISELFHRARIGAPAILFIDEIDALVGCRGNREKGPQERILSAFLIEMDGLGLRVGSGTSQAKVIVVAATNRPDVLDPALTRPGRFDRLIYVGPPDTSQRLDILHTLVSRMSIAEDVDLTLVAEKTSLFSGADLAQLCKEAGLCAMIQDGMAVKEITQKHWISALHKMKPSLSHEQIKRYHQLNNFFIQPGR